MANAIKLTWTPRVRLSGLQAARVVGCGDACVDAFIESRLTPLVGQLNQRLIAQNTEVDEFWTSLVRQAALQKDNVGDRRLADQPLCEAALKAAGSSEFQLEQNVPAVANLIGQCRRVMSERYPKLGDQLELRGKPLRQAWETYGPGMMAMIAARIWRGEPPDDWSLRRAEVLLVQPMRGGDGDIVGEDRIWIEAMLTDAMAELPEVLRAIYLTTRLAIDRHIRRTSGESLSLLPWREAAVMIVLDAAGELGLVSTHDLPVETAVRSWLRRGDSLAPVLRRWWTEYQETGSAMPVALKALRRMIDSYEEDLAARAAGQAGLDELLDDEMLRELGIHDD